MPYEINRVSSKIYQTSCLLLANRLAGDMEISPIVRVSDLRGEVIEGPNGY